MGSRKKQKCGKKFRFPTCLTEPCRHECVNNFNEGRKVQLVLAGTKKKQKEEKKVHIGTKEDKFDDETLSILFSEILLGLPIRKRRSQNVIKIYHKEKIILWVEYARKNELHLLSIPGMKFPKINAILREKKKL